MGYTTNFAGRFTLDKPLTVVQYNELMDMSGKLHRDLEGAPDAYLQWQPTKNGLGIERDGGEKFYEYEKRAEFLFNKLKDWGITMTGSVQYQGEDVSDNGTLVIENGKCIRKENKMSSDKVRCPHCEECFHIEQSLAIN